jgi:hypothetical protein
MNISDIKIDSILSDMDISRIVERIFQVGERKETTAIAWHTGEEIDAHYYDFSLKDMIDKEDSLGISKEDFLNLICRWMLLNKEIQRIGEKRGGIMDTDKFKYRKSIEQRNSLWVEIEQIFNLASIPAHFTSSLNEDAARLVYQELISNSYLDEKTPENDFLYRLGVIDMPDSNNLLKWIKTNKTTKGIVPNKKSLLNFLSLIGISDKEISDKALINNVFEIPKGGQFKANNYTYTNNKLNVISEYHNELETIVNKSK